MLTALYVHVPFCNQICTYCDFHKEMATFDKKQTYINALNTEIIFHQKQYQNLQTIYIGGGTPTALDLELLESLLQTIKQNIDLKQIIEYSIEGNPNDITKELVSLLKEYGVNRVSLGVQTFQPHHLIFLNRSHQNSDVLRAVTLLREGGITNINIDMIFSLINQTMEELEDDLQQIIKLPITHISYYSLILEEKTVLDYLYNQNKISINSEDLEGTMYTLVIDTLENHGFKQYEISNFTNCDLPSLHNLIYWQNKDYLAVGSGAHSLLDEKRYYNVRNVSKYIDAIHNNLPYQTSYEREKLSEEMIMGLRLLQGIHIPSLEELYKITLLDTYPEITTFIREGLLEIQNDYLRLTKQGLLLGNLVFAYFLED